MQITSIKSNIILKEKSPVKYIPTANAATNIKGKAFLSLFISTMYQNRLLILLLPLHPQQKSKQQHK